MPYSSKAQARKFHSDPKLRKYTKAYDEATDFACLPEKKMDPDEDRMDVMAAKNKRKAKRKKVTRHPQKGTGESQHSMGIVLEGRPFPKRGKKKMKRPPTKGY